MRQHLVKIALSALIALSIIACSDNESTTSNPDPIWEESSAVLYSNLGRLHSKGNIAGLDIEQIIEDIFDDQSLATDIALGIITNPDNSGIAIDKPAYVAIREYDDEQMPTNVIASFELSDASKLDTLLKGLDECITPESVSLNGDKRIIILDSNVAVGYNSERFVAIYNSTESEEKNLGEELTHKLDYSPADMSRFHGLDIALYIDIDKIAERQLNTMIAANEAELELSEEESMELREELTELYSQYFKEQASTTFGLSFESGAILLSTDFEGVSDDITAHLKQTNTKHLKLLSASPIAILNLGINGEAMADLIDNAMDSMSENEGLAGISNEINIYKNIGLSIVSSINGNLMFALSEADGKLIDDIIDGSRLVFTKANALFTADVKDDYIMQNIETFAGPFLKKSGKHSYSIEAFGNKLSVGQQDNMFYVGVNNAANEKRHSAADEEWSNNIMGSYAYAMVDFKQLFSTSFGRAALSTIYDHAPNKDQREIIKLVINHIDKLHILSNGEGDTIHCECSLTLRNGHKNALEQITDLFKPTANN